MLLFSIAAYFVMAAVVLAGGRFPRWGRAVAIVPFAGQLAVVAALWPDAAASETTTLDWIPALGISIEVIAGPFSLLLTAVVAGIGLLISIYSVAYFTDPRRRSRFLSYMLVFSGGMAGIVASNDLFGLFLFWEVTTVASYLLIGFDDEQATARASALQALLVTTLGGLAMLGGFVLLALEAGTSRITELVAQPPSGTIVDVALVLVFVGAFAKSAQFPFHFWLPAAMAAPTPASAYLHSATMVKAGIVLLILLAPGFAATGLWLWVVTTIGLITMLVGAVGALRRDDLKLLLAYGTVSQLGFIVALVGLGHIGAAVAVLVAHALFKAALFLVVGVVDKATGTRDIRRLSGLGSRLPALAAMAAVAAASMAGVPPLLGFVSKEVALDELIAGRDWFPLLVIALASALTVAYTARFWFGAFGTKTDVESPGIKRVAAGLWLGPAVLAGLTLVFGLFPGLVDDAIVDAASQKIKLVLWPGWKPALAVSAAIVAVGSVLYLLAPRLERSRLAIALPSRPRSAGEHLYASSVRGLNKVADAVTGRVQNGSLPTYLAIILSAVLIVPTAAWLASPALDLSLRLTNGLPEVALALVVIAGAVAATRAQRRMAAALLLGVVGYAIAGLFVAFGAPDLALTQVLIETLTIALFAVVLVKLPRRFGPRPRSLSSRTRIAVAATVGVFVTAASVVASSVQHDRSIADAYIRLAPEAGGENVVNVILTNFRAIDTLGEITVLAAAAVGITALVQSARRLQGAGS